MNNLDAESSIGQTPTIPQSSGQKKFSPLVIIFVAVLLLIFSLIFYKNLKQTKDIPSRKAIENIIGQTKFDIVEIAQIPPLSKTVYTVWLKSNQGEKLVFRGVVELIGTVKSLDSVKETFLRGLSIFSDSIIFLEDNTLYIYDKNTKNIRTSSLPEEVFKQSERFGEIINLDEKIESLDLRAEELNNNFILLRFFSADGYTKHGVYLLNKKDLSFSKIQQFENSCNYIYCTGPWLLKKLTDNEIIFEQGGGDACWNAGVIHKYNLENNSLIKLLEYTGGCYNDKDDFIGMLGNEIISAKHVWGEDVASDFGSTLYKEVYKIDPSGAKTTLIPQAGMPSEIKMIWVIEGGSIYLSNENDKYYLYDLQTNIVKEVNKENIVTPSPYEEKKPEETINNNSAYLRTEVKKVGINRLTGANTWSTGLSIVDDDKDEIEAFSISFLDGKFDAERTDPRFMDKLNVYKHTELSDVRVLDNDNVIFTGNLLYSTSEGLKLIESKIFVLNIKTGKIYLVKSAEVN